MFTIIGKIFGYVALIGGIMKIVGGFYVAANTSNMFENIELSSRYLAAANSGEAIDTGFYWIMLGTAFGIASEISATLKRILLGRQV